MPCGLGSICPWRELACNGAHKPARHRSRHHHRSSARRSNSAFRCAIRPISKNSSSCRFKVRGDRVSPMFDPCGLVSSTRTGRSGWELSIAPAILSLQAFRLDIVHPNLAEWALGWMAGLYIKRNELVLPSAIEPPAHSRSRTAQGAPRLPRRDVDRPRTVKKRECFDTVSQARHAARPHQMAARCACGR